MMEPDIGKAISILCPKGVFSITENDYDRIDWQSPEVTQPSKSAIQAKLASMISEYDAQEYARNRQAEYPSITDVTVALAEKMEGQPHFWNEITALRLEVKSKYPKP